MISQSEGEIETIDIDNCLEHSDKTGFECNCQTDAVRLANPPQPKLRNSHSAQINESPALGSPVPQAILPFVWDFTTGVEYESAGRQVPKSSKVLRDDLAPLMFVLAAPTDIVLVTKRPRKKFLASLVTVGFQNLPHFQLRPLTKGLSIAGLRSYGLPGNHLRRSNVVKYRAISTPRPRADANLFHAQNHGSNEHKLHQHQEYQTEHKRKVANRIPQDRIKNIYKANVQLKNNVCDSEEGDISNNCDVYVCRSMEEIDAAAALFKNNVVIKAEFSSAGQGCRFKWGPSMTDTNRKKNYSNTKTKNGDKINLVRQWAKNRLKQDGCVTVEEKWKIELELSAEFLYGKWNGVSLQLTNHGRWCGQYLGKPVELIRSRSKSNTGKHIHSLENKKVVTKSNNKTTIKTSSLHMCFNAVDKQQACTKSKISKEVFDFVFLNQAVQKKLFPLNIPATCGAPFGTCGADVAIVKNCEGDLEVRIMEVNARVTMSHLAVAAARRIRQSKLDQQNRPMTSLENCNHAKDHDANFFKLLEFRVVHLSELTCCMIPLTDPASAVNWCAVVVTNTVLTHGLIAQDIRGNEEWVIRAARVRASRENPDALRAIK